MAPKKKTKTELGAKVTDAGEEGGEFLCAGPATGALAPACVRWRAARLCARSRNLRAASLGVPAICGLLPLPDSAVHLLWVAAGEPDNRAEKEQADAAAAEESPTVITSAGPEAPKLDLAGMLSPGAAPRAPRSVRPLGPGGRSPCGLCISPYAASPPPGHGGRRLQVAGCGATPGNRWDFLRSVAAAPLELCWARVNGVGKGGSDPAQHDLCLTGWREMRASCDARKRVVTVRWCL